jgi:hypothetical protein
MQIKSNSISLWDKGATWNFDSLKRYLFGASGDIKTLRHFYDLQTEKSNGRAELVLE